MENTISKYKIYNSDIAKVSQILAKFSKNELPKVMSKSRNQCKRQISLRFNTFRENKLSTGRHEI